MGENKNTAIVYFPLLPSLNLPKKEYKGHLKAFLVFFVDFDFFGRMFSKRLEDDVFSFSFLSYLAVNLYMRRFSRLFRGFLCQTSGPL